jgi:phosphotransferase system enzyme I (PtsI)
MNIPMVVGVKNATDVINSTDRVVLDGRNGKVVVHPVKKTCEKYQSLIDQQLEAKTDFEAVCKKPNKTKDGSPFSLQANAEFTEELSTAQKYCADGIGLLRTESIYLSRKNFTDQEQQESFYATILKATKPHPVTIRLFDAGGDKFFEEGEKEQNPFLGWRGIRMLLDEEELLLNQLRAVLSTAAKFKDRVRILVPMITTLEELLEVRELVQKVQDDLASEGVSIDEDVSVGIMAEVPSVALQAELFAQYADFLSIGTNDLTQYVLAVDRGNERISSLYDQRHPAIWQLINRIAKAAQKEQVPLSICGELASDPIAACCLMGLGINTLSMNSVVLPTVKQMLRAYSLEEMQQLSKKVLASDTLDDINQIFSNWNKIGN